MGIYDRDYYRDDEPRGWFAGDQTVVVTLILVNVAVYLIEVFAGDQVGKWIEDTLSARGNSLWQPWLWWQFVTYGFVHDPSSFTHVLFNMIGLFFFGRDVEAIYGRKQFAWLYFTALVASGVGWALVDIATADGKHQHFVIGASGAVTAVLVIFCFHFPHRQVLLMFFPVPAWLLALILVGRDFLSALHPNLAGESNVAYVGHLAGAVYGFLFYRTQWSFYRLAPSQLGASWRKLTRPKLRVHQPDRAPPKVEGGNLQSRVDDILEKISRSGQDSLTPEERSILENASRHYQQQRRK